MNDVITYSPAIQDYLNPQKKSEKEIKFNYNGFKMICQATQENIRRYLVGQMTRAYGENNIIANDSYIFCDGNCDILLVCHMDTVHKSLPDKIICDKENGMIYAPNGIGGDDRCGIYAALAVLKYSNVKPSILFTTDEEIGCVGSKKAAKDLLTHSKGFKYLLEMDRHGDKEVVFYETTNREFINYIVSFGFVEKNGASSDIRHLSEKWGMASANVSIGYFNEHTKQEYVESKYLIDTIKKVITMVESAKDTHYWPMKASTKSNLTK